MTLFNSAREHGGDELGTLLEFYRPYLTKLAADWIDSELRPRFSESDAVQQTMISAAAGFAKFTGDSEREFRKWIIAILQNQLVDGWRFHQQAERRDVRREEPLDQRKHQLTQPDKPLADNAESIERLLSGIETLPDKLRDIVRARYLEGLSFEEIAEQHEASRETVRRRWKEAVQELSRVLRGNDD